LRKGGIEALDLDREQSGGLVQRGLHPAAEIGEEVLTPRIRVEAEQQIPARGAVMGPQIQALVEFLQQIRGLDVVLNEEGVRQRNGGTTSPSRAATAVLLVPTPPDMSRTLTTDTLA
jgi:hypothetical protein